MIDATDLPSLDVYRAESGIRAVEWDAFKAWSQVQFAAPGVRVRAGERLALRDETRIVYTVFWRRPVQSGGVAVIPDGEILTVAVAPSEEAVDFLAVPENYRAIEEAVVPAADRRRRTYNGFAIRLCLRDLDRAARRLDEGAPDTELSARLDAIEAPWLRSGRRRRGGSGRG